MHIHALPSPWGEGGEGKREGGREGGWKRDSGGDGRWGVGVRPGERRQEMGRELSPLTITHSHYSPYI